MPSSTHSQRLIAHLSIQTRLHKRLNGSLSIHGISLTEYLVLRQLSQAPKQQMRRVDLADRIGLSASGITRLLNPMQKIGLVAKEVAPRDARVSLVSLTQAGQTIFSESSLSFDASADQLLSGLNTAQLQAMDEISQALR